MLRLGCLQGDGLQKVGLAEARSTINKERIVVHAGILGGAGSGGCGYAVAVGNDEVPKRVPRVQRDENVPQCVAGGVERDRQRELRTQLREAPDARRHALDVDRRRCIPVRVCRRRDRPLDDGQRMGQVFDRPDRLRGLATRAITLGRVPT